MKIFSLIIFSFVFSSVGFSQVSAVVPKDGNSDDAVEGFEFSFRNCFNGGDWFTGFDFGWTDFDYKYSVTGAFEWRPFRTKVLIDNGDSNFYQFREKRYLPMINAEKFFKVASVDGAWFGTYFNVGAGYLFGDYKGTKINPKTGFEIVPSAGAMISFNNEVTLHVGAEYLNSRTVSIKPIRFVVNVNFHPTNN